jgi:hypothetical protein
VQSRCLLNFVGPLRTCDADLLGAIRVGDPQIGDLWKRLPFVLEAKGQVEDNFLQSAQSKVKNASQHATAAAYALFKTQLENDATLHRKQLLQVQAEGTKKRQAVAIALQAAHDTAWDLIQKKAADEFPTFMYTNTKDLSSAAMAAMAPWLQDSLKAVSGGLHRAENDRVVYWANLCVLGVITVNSAKFHWLADFLTSQLAQMPLNSVAVILLGNRSPAKSVKKRCEPQAIENLAARWRDGPLLDRSHLALNLFCAHSLIHPSFFAVSN